MDGPCFTGTGGKGGMGKEMPLSVCPLACVFVSNDKINYYKPFIRYTVVLFYGS